MIKKILFIGLFCFASVDLVLASQKLELDPRHKLSLQEVYEVAYEQREVKLSSQAIDNIKKSHNVLMEAALLNKPVYGLTVGVGWNKDKPVFYEENGKKNLSKELLELSKKFNVMSLRAHALGLGKTMEEAIVRAAMLIRLNTLINGETGVSLGVAQAYVNFLNNGITPVVPSNGSVGEADITLAAHIGLAMIGEWKVTYKGREYRSLEALKMAGLKPIEIVGKDFLSILSNNSLSNAEAVLNVLKAQKFYHQEIRLFALLLEGFNGNVAPFSEGAVENSGFEALQEVSAKLRQTLVGSDLWKTSPQRSLQDPLSFRTMNYAFANVLTAIKEAKTTLQIQINRSDDNPLVLLKELKTQSSQLDAYNIKGSGAIYPTANFSNLPIVLRIESLNIALARLAENMTQQLIRISNPDFTRLSRFLNAPTNNGHGFGAIEKPFSQSNIMIKNLAQPQSFNTVVLAGNIEDVASMGNLSIRNLGKIIRHLYEISAFELLEGTQALDLREGFVSSKSSSEIKKEYRKIVPFVKEDRVYSEDIFNSIQFAKQLSF